MESKEGVCCKKDAAEDCTKKGDGICTFTTMCKLQTLEGEFPCECICTCKCSSGDCKQCVCKCECKPENAQKIQFADGTVKYRCECNCEC